MANTTNYGLYKPNRADTTVEVDTSLANNFTIIDTEMKARKDATDSLDTRTTTTEGRLDTLVLSAGDSNAEIVEARGTFGFLKQRLDDVDADIASVQLRKITADTGDAKILASLGGDDILAKILAAGIGLQTFYAVAGCVNNPSATLPLRGVANFTTANTGYVLAFTTANDLYVNTCNAGTWGTWDSLVTTKAPVWTNLTLVNGAGVNNSRPPKFTKQGNTVYLIGEVLNITGIIGYLPAGFRPKQFPLNFRTALATGVSPVDSTVAVGVDGSVNILANGNTSAGISLAGITFIAEQ